MNKLDPIYNFIGFLFDRVLSFVKELLLARMLGPYFYGLRGIFLFFHNIYYYLLGGSDIYVYREISNNNWKLFDKFVGQVLFVSLFSSILTIIISFLLDGVYKIMGLLMIFVIPFRLLAHPIDIFLRAKFEFNFRSKLLIVTSLSLLIASVILSYFYGLYGALLGIIIGMAIRFLVFWIYYGKFFSLKLISWDEYLKLLKDSYPFLLISASALFMMQIDRLILVFNFSPEVLAFYGFAMGFMFVVNGIVSSLFQPINQHFIKGSKLEHVKGVVNLVINIASILMVLVYYFISVVISINYGDYLPSKDIFLLLMSGMLLYNVNSILYNLLLYKKKELLLSKNLLLGGISNLVVSFGLMNLFDFYAVPIATSLSFLFLTIANFRALKLDLPYGSLIYFLAFLLPYFFSYLLIPMFALIVLYSLYSLFSNRLFINYLNLLREKLISL